MTFLEGVFVFGLPLAVWVYVVWHDYRNPSEDR